VRPRTSPVPARQRCQKAPSLSAAARLPRAAYPSPSKRHVAIHVAVYASSVGRPSAGLRASPWRSALLGTDAPNRPDQIQSRCPLTSLNAFLFAGKHRELLAVQRLRISIDRALGPPGRDLANLSACPDSAARARRSLSRRFRSFATDCNRSLRNACLRNGLRMMVLEHPPQNSEQRLTGDRNRFESRSEPQDATPTDRRVTGGAVRSSALLVTRSP
jgi:hypothetical protein